MPPPAEDGDTRTVVDAPDRAAWRAWLERHHERSGSVWLRLSRGDGDGERSLRYEDAVQEGLCFGWIDSRARKRDDVSYDLLFAPRKRGSGWARTNKRRIERLLAEGRMAPAGLAAIEAAKADGSWTLLDLVEDLVEPDDLRAALDATPLARANWDGFPPSARRGILEWIAVAKRATTREQRVAETATLAAQGIRANQWPRPPRGG